MNYKLNTEPQKANWDSLKWGFIFLLIVAGLWANYHFSQVEWALRLAGWIILACLSAAIVLQTAVGRHTWLFVKQARGELRKVAWPARQETIQTTMIIVGMVVLTSLILWGIDSILLWIVQMLTGQRG